MGCQVTLYTSLFVLVAPGARTLTGIETEIAFFIFWVYLIEVDDFINNEGDQLKHLKNKLTGNIIRILHLGGYATPLEPLEIKTRISDSFEKQEPHE